MHQEIRVLHVRRKKAGNGRGRTPSDVLSITYNTNRCSYCLLRGDDACYGRLFLPSPLVICVVLVDD